MCLMARGSVSSLHQGSSHLKRAPKALPYSPPRSSPDRTFCSGKRLNRRENPQEREIDRGPHMSREPSVDPENTAETVAVRAGETGHNVRYVLAFGLAGVIAAFILVLLWYF